MARMSDSRWLRLTLGHAADTGLTHQHIVDLLWPKLTGRARTQMLRWLNEWAQGNVAHFDGNSHTEPLAALDDIVRAMEDFYLAHEVVVNNMYDLLVRPPALTRLHKRPPAAALKRGDYEQIERDVSALNVLAAQRRRRSSED